MLHHINHKGKSAVQTTFHLPFGELFVEQTTGGFDSRYKFSGKEMDNETGYNYFGARYYDSDLSNWLSVDPMSDSRPNISPYNYCRWNPMILTDPNGALDDGYTVDECGNINKVDNSGGNYYDVLYNKDEYLKGNRLYGTDQNNDGIIIDKSIMKSKQSENVLGTNGLNYDMDRYKISGDEKSEDILLWLSKNTEVEWSRLQVGKPTKEDNRLTTSHDELADIGPGWHASAKYTINQFDHIHPNNITPSRLDKIFARDYLNKDTQLRILYQGYFYEWTVSKKP